MNPTLELRDIHLPPEPSWWPPAVGWWLLAVLLIAAATWVARALWRRARARRVRAALRAEFENAAALVDPAARAVAVSELLRRAARRRDPASAALHGEAWLDFLDAMLLAARRDATSRPFRDGPGRALLDAPYRAAVDARAVEALVVPARACYQALVEAP
jgi:hypothetical protein